MEGSLLLWGSAILLWVHVLWLYLWVLLLMNMAVNTHVAWSVWIPDPQSDRWMEEIKCARSNTALVQGSGAGRNLHNLSYQAASGAVRASSHLLSKGKLAMRWHRINACSTQLQSRANP